jgi:hypothetical protein
MAFQLKNKNFFCAAGSSPARGREEQRATQNFVDIMFKIHNKIQNIKTADSNWDPILGSYLSIMWTEGLLFVVGVSGLAKIIYLSKI